MVRAATVLALLLAIVGCGGPEPAEKERAEPPPPLTVRVMSFNLRWDGFKDGKYAWVHRRDLVYRVLREFRPDSVGTQEPMIRQIQDIEDAIPALDSYRFDNDPVVTRTQQILYRRERFERIEGDGFLVADGTNEGGTIRYCTWVRLKDRTSGRSYYHYNVHLDHRKQPSRVQSVVRLMKHIASRGSDDPFVVTGDFNAPEKGPAMSFLFGTQPLRDEKGLEYTNPIPLVDTYRFLHGDAPESGTAGGFRGNRKGGKIDHVLVAVGAATVREASILHTNEAGRYPSDHFPVTAVFEWP
jgi:endonuclease/exonuclease/phosphatase family metal-dependent hydrolase